MGNFQVQYAVVTRQIVRASIGFSFSKSVTVFDVLSHSVPARVHCFSFFTLRQNKKLHTLLTVHRNY